MAEHKKTYRFERTARADLRSGREAEEFGWECRLGDPFEGGSLSRSVMVNSDKHWAELGRQDPYLGTVKTLDPYKVDPTLTREMDGYFESGNRYLTDLWTAIRQHVTPDFNPRLAVDFGCSVGRVAIPLATRCQSVLGLDVSRGALAEAEKNAARRGVSNTRWVASDDDLTRIDQPIDFFHSYNVLQHVPVDRGLHVVERALSKLAPGGVIAVHVPYADRASSARKIINWAQAPFPVYMSSGTSLDEARQNIRTCS